MVHDLEFPVGQLLFGRQLAEEQQIGHLQKGALLGQLLDGVAPIAQDALVAVDIGDLALARSRVVVARIVGHHAELFGVDLDLAQVDSLDRVVLDRHFVLGAGAVVGDSEGVAHNSLLLHMGKANEMLRLELIVNC